MTSLVAGAQMAFCHASAGIGNAAATGTGEGTVAAVTPQEVPCLS